MNLLQRAALASKNIISRISTRGTQGLGAQQRGWRAARIDRATADWFTTAQSINQELRSDLDRLRHRGRDLTNNNDYARKFVRMVQDNVVGPSGVRLQVRIEDRPGKPDRLASQAVETAWKEWQAVADVTGQQTLVEMCHTLVGSLPADGEFLVRMVKGADAGNKFNFALQLIDVERIDTSYNVESNNGSNAVVMGVEIDSYRRPVALWIFASSAATFQSRERVRLPMQDVIHAFRMERGEQLRGVPWMAAGMLSLHHLGNFKLAALLAAEHGANHYGFFQTPDGVAPIGALDGNGETITTSQPGTYDTLPPGVNFVPHESKYPEANFGPFVKTTLQRIASGWGVAYHSLANDLENVNFSSIRSGTLEERDRWMVDQEWFIAKFMEPVFLNWLQMALVSGAVVMPMGSALPASKFDKFKKHEWQARRWDWVDPRSDTEASILKVKAGLMSPQDLAASMGYDFEDTLAAIKAAQELAAEYGVGLTAYDALPGANGAKNTNNQASAPAVDAAQAKAAPELQAMRDMGERLDAAIKTMTERPPAPPAVVTVNMPEMRHEHHTHVSTPNVEVYNEVSVPETTVNVEAVMPEVKAAAPAVQVVNNVTPSEVVVNNCHPHTAIQTVERDENDEIVRTVTRYED